MRCRAFEIEDPIEVWNHMDYFPVENEQEAEEINKKYDGFQLEFDSGLKYMICDKGCCHWS